MLLENKIRTKYNKSLWNLFIKFITMIGKKHLLYKLEIKEVEEIIGTINCEEYDEENILYAISYLDENIKEEKINWINFYYKKTYNKTKKEFVTNILKEQEQEAILQKNNLKILIAGHPYNLYDDLVGTTIKKYLTKENIEILYSDKIDHSKINQECRCLSTDIHWTHSKEVIASINYYKDKVDGIILISSFPCGPDSLSNELISRKVKNIPVITLIFEDLNSEVGIITRLESFIDILKNIKEEANEKSN